MKKKIAIVLTLLVLSVAIAVPSIVSAAESAGTTRSGSMVTYFKSLIQGLVDDKKLAQADAAAVISELDAKAAELEANRPEKGSRLSDGRMSGLDMAEVASVIGVTEDQLKEKMTAGSTLWKIAADAGKLDALKAAIIAKTREKLAAQVTDGKLTQAQADERLAALKTKVEAITADSTQNDLGAFGGGRGGRGGHGQRGEKTAKSDAKATQTASTPSAA